VSISPDPPTQSKKPVVVYIGGCNVTRGGVERTHTQGIIHYLRKHADLYFIGGYDAGSQPIAGGLLLKTIDEHGLSPIKLYEYVAAGRPIITSDTNDINIVGDLGIGATVPMPLEREALKETISRFLSMSADQLDAMEQRAWDILCERFTWDKRGDQILGWVHEDLP